ncbi:hypothetical protein [Serratia sp. CY74737]|uniref:hypothetical protein n=1 Tax=Serratia sp. CY74737 TaxID=3383677 RepID=UPI003FA123EC
MKLDQDRLSELSTAIGRTVLDLVFSGVTINNLSIAKQLRYFAFRTKDLQYMGILLDAAELLKNKKNHIIDDSRTPKWEE